MSLAVPDPPRANRLLGALSAAEFAALVSQLERVSFGFKDLVFDQDSRLDSVYFPVGCVICLLRRVDDGSAVEIARVGREGMVGVPAFLGAATLGEREFAMVQAPGAAMRMNRAHFMRAVAEAGPLHFPVQRYVHEFMSGIAQQAVCSGLHSIEQRCSRWLLFTQDHLGGQEFPLTHDFLSEMLHTRRSSVTHAAGNLQAAQLIRYRRGWVTVVDRPGLERTACECYRLTKGSFGSPLF